MTALFPPLRPKFSAALRDAASRSPKARAAAADALGGANESQADEAKRALRPLVADPAAAVRCSAIASLGRLNDTEALDRVVNRFDDGDPTVRQIAVIAAGEIGDPRAIPALERALQRSSPEMRFQAVASLAMIAGRDAITALERLVEDEDREVRAHLAEALGSLEAEPAIPALERLVQDEARIVRESAAVALARCGSDAGAEELVLLLSDRDRCFEAAWALGELKVASATEPLAGLATARLKPLAARAAAAAALVRLGDPRGEPALARVLRAIRPDARGYAAQLVGELQLCSLAPDLIKLTERPRGADPVVVVEAVAKLAEASEMARAALIRISEGDDPAAERARTLLTNG